jgi:hypothetical protein
MVSCHSANLQVVYKNRRHEQFSPLNGTCVLVHGASWLLISDDEWVFITLYVTLMALAAPLWQYPLCEVFNGLRWLGRVGVFWRMMPDD